MPLEVKVDDSAWLNCSFDLQGDELYSIKWYKDSIEFYRFLPKSDPPGPEALDCDGIYLDVC
jgi:beat protein, putative